MKANTVPRGASSARFHLSFLLLLLFLSYPVSAQAPAYKTLSADGSLSVTLTQTAALETLKTVLGKLKAEYLPHGNQKLIMISLMLENLAKPSGPTLVLDPQATFVQDSRGRYQLVDCGVFPTKSISGGSSVSYNAKAPLVKNIGPISLQIASESAVDWTQIVGIQLSPNKPVFLPSGVVDMLAEKWELKSEGDSRSRSTTIPPGSSVKIALLFSVPSGANSLELTIPSFPNITLPDLDSIPIDTPTETKLFLCTNKTLGEEYDGDGWCYRYIYPPDGHEDFTYALPGSINGDKYSLNIFVGNEPGSEYNITLFVKEDNSTILSTSAKVDSSGIKQLSKTFSVPAVSAKKGDHLILRISAKSGNILNLLVRDGDRFSYITLPPVK